MADLLLKIDARDLARVLPFVADRDVRYYLCGVHVEPHEHGAILIATNGHMLAATLSRESTAKESAILAIDRRFASEIRKSANARSAINPRIEVADLQSRAEVCRDTSGRRVDYVTPDKAIINGQFPDWRRIIPPAEHLADGVPGCINAAYLKRMIDAAAAAHLGTDRYRGLTFQYDGRTPDASPLIVRSTDVPDLLIVGMGLRDNARRSFPAWVAKAPDAPGSLTDSAAAA